MAKKQLNTTGIVNELEHSSFFSKPAPAPSQPSPIPSPALSTPFQEHVIPPSKPASKKASTLASIATDFIEAVRKSVKQIGKEVSFVRLTPEEKRQLKDIAYTYQRQGQRTSENEISRIGINYILQDYQAHGRTSILARVLDALNA